MFTALFPRFFPTLQTRQTILSYYCKTACPHLYMCRWLRWIGKKKDISSGLADIAGERYAKERMGKEYLQLYKEMIEAEDGRNNILPATQKIYSGSSLAVCMRCIPPFKSFSLYLTVLTSKRETYGMACAESLACGTPVVAFLAGGTESIALEVQQYSCLLRSFLIRFKSSVSKFFKSIKRGWQK